MRSTYRALRRLRAGTLEADGLRELAAASGPLARLFSPVFRLVSRSAHMYPVGFLFGLGFDTATEVAVLGLAATEAAKGLAAGSILLFPALLAAGMALIDTLDSTLMVGAYGWAFARPAAKLHYNMTMTGISILIAAAVAAVEGGGLLADRLRLVGWPWDWLAVLNSNFALLGYLIVAYSPSAGWSRCSLSGQAVGADRGRCRRSAQLTRVLGSIERTLAARTRSPREAGSLTTAGQVVRG